MVQGVDVELFRPDDELKKLAKLAVELGVADALDEPATVDQALAAVAEQPRGAEWIAAWKAAKDPVVQLHRPATASTPPTNTGSSTSTSRSATSRDYIRGVRQGKKIERPDRGNRRRARPDHRRIPRAARRRARGRLRAKLGLARTVFPYVENHNFYIEHWSMGVFWRKMRELGR